MAVRVQADDFDVGAELAALTAGDTSVGAVASFVGLVRDMAPGKVTDGGDTGRIAALTLEHYPGMTERRLAAIEAEARRRWPLAGCLIVHRHGRLLPGDRIVLVACASAHREAAFQACAFLMDWLKTRAPFWKAESSADGDVWVDAKVSDEAAAARWDTNEI